MDPIPVPHDLELPLPLPGGVLKVLLVFLFLVHILFVNLMVGGSTYALLFEILGRFRDKYDRLAHAVSRTITVSKSLAVVLGVAPLLAINLAYTHYFYSANVLTGAAWLMILPAVILAFLLSYLHNYTWESWAVHLKGLHIAVGAAAAVLFWTIPLIFLTNVNLMLFPVRWTEVSGFISALLLPNVLPRYAHFMFACLSVTALFAVPYFGRERAVSMAGWSKPELVRTFYQIALITTLAQFLFGPLNFFTLPVHGLAWKVYGLFALGVVSALLLTSLLWRAAARGEAGFGGQYSLILLLLTATVVAMAFGRHAYRERAVLPHRQQMADKTETKYWNADAARARARMGITAEAMAGPESDFQANCSVCHAPAKTLVGPSLAEIAEIYRDDAAGLVSWTRAPGVKRGGIPMPPFQHLGEVKLKRIAEYILETY